MAFVMRHSSNDQERSMLTLSELRRMTHQRFTPEIVEIAGLFAAFSGGGIAVILAVVFHHLELPVQSVLFFVTLLLLTVAAFIFMLTRLAFSREDTP
jgi:hypothetical protein